MAKLTPTKAIRLKCLDCTGQNRKDIKTCEETSCPLHSMRDGKRPKGARPLKTIRKYCLWCMIGQIREITLCPSEECIIFSYRNGHRPKKEKIIDVKGG